MGSTRYDCELCGVYIPNSQAYYTSWGTVRHWSQCPDNIPTTPTTPVRYNVKVRAFCQSPNARHDQCSGVQLSDDKRSAHVCSCECHTTGITPILDASES